MNFPVLVLGAGGHAKVLIEALSAASIEILGVVDPDPTLTGMTVQGVPVLGDDREVLKHPNDAVRLVNGLGSIGLPTRRQSLFEQFKAQGYAFATVVHPSAVVATDAQLGEGSQIMAGVVIQPGCRIGMNAVLNTRVSIDHDCCIGDHVHIAPGTVLSGNVSVGKSTHIGTGSTIIQGITVGRHTVVGAGSVLLKDVPSGVTVYGVPAKVVHR